MITNKDFVLIEFLLNNSSLSIYVRAQDLTPSDWVRAMQMRKDEYVIEGFNVFTATAIAMSVSHKLCFGIRASYAGKQWVEKYKNVNGDEHHDE